MAKKIAMRSKIVFGTKTRYYVNDVEVTEKEYRKLTKPRALAAGDEVLTQSTSAWQDFKSEAMAVHPKQVAEANARSKRHNLGVVYDKKGFAHIPDRAARKRLLKVEGFHDKKGGYGD